MGMPWVPRFVEVEKLDFFPKRPTHPG
jgi:hypothetical protein